VAKLLKLQKAIAKLAPLGEKAEKAVGYLVQKAAEEVYGDEVESEVDDEDEECSDEEGDEFEGEEEEEEEGDMKSKEEEEEEDDDAIRKKKMTEKRKNKEMQFEKKSKALIRVSEDNGMKSSKKKTNKRGRSTLLGNDAGDIESIGVAAKVQVCFVCIQLPHFQCVTSYPYLPRTHVGNDEYHDTKAKV
jgi:hypothetical protein